MPLDIQKNYLNCPFREKQIKNSDTGKSIKIGFCVGLLVLALALTVYSLKKISYSPVFPLRAKVYATFDDYLAFGFIFIENAQILSIGPDFASFNRLMSDISQLLSLNLANVISFKDQTFWVIFYAILSLTYA